MGGQLLAWVGLVACGAMLVRLTIGERRRRVLDGWLQRTWFVLRRRFLLLYRWRTSSREAERQANEAINRARNGGAKVDGKWEGNVYTPESFRGPRKPH
jgi:hypothetical protein